MYRRPPPKAPKRKKTKKRTKLDPLSKSGEYIGPPEPPVEDSWDKLSSSSSSSSSEEEEDVAFELESSDPPVEENEAETQLLLERATRVRNNYPQDVWNGAPHLWIVDGLLIFIKFAVLTFYWPVHKYTDMHFVPTDSDEELLHKMLYHRWITAIQETWSPKLHSYIEIRLRQFLRDMQHSIGPTHDHPLYAVFYLIQKIQLVRVKRKIKRMPGIDTQEFIFEASTGDKYTMDQLRECIVVCDERTGRPIIEKVNGRELVKTIPNPDAIVGTDPRRPKSLIFVPQKSDTHPYDVHDDELSAEGQLIEQIDELTGVAAPRKDTIEVVLVQPLHAQFLSLHDFIHYLDEISSNVVHFLEFNPYVPTSFDDAWAHLTGVHATSPLSKFTKSKGHAFNKIVVNARNMLQHNVNMIQCDACSAIEQVICVECPTCHMTIRYCNAVCKPKATTAHGKTSDHKKYK